MRPDRQRMTPWCGACGRRRAGASDGSVRLWAAAAADVARPPRSGAALEATWKLLHEVRLHAVAHRQRPRHAPRQPWLEADLAVACFGR